MPLTSISICTAISSCSRKTVTPLPQALPHFLVLRRSTLMHVDHLPSLALGPNYLATPRAFRAADSPWASVIWNWVHAEHRDVKGSTSTSLRIAFLTPARKCTKRTSLPVVETNFLGVINTKASAGLNSGYGRCRSNPWTGGTKITPSLLRCKLGRPIL